MYRWIALDEHWTHVYCLGDLRIDSTSAKKSSSTSIKGSIKERKRLIVVFVGNPGVCRFYESFAHRLHCSIPNSSVWVVSHLNHDFDSKETKSALDSKCWSLNEQIRHKLSFILTYIPVNDVRLILIGHSIGCYIILHVLSELTERRRYDVERCFFIFPTIENMQQTPNGRSFTRAATFRVHYFIKALTYLLYFTSDSFKDYLIRLNLTWGNSNKKPIEDCIVKGARQMFDTRVVSNSIFMAMDELTQVEQLDEDLMRQFYHKITIFYGQNDGWCPISFYQRAKRRNIASKILLCDPHVEHAFVVRDSDTVARLIVEELNNPEI